MTTATVMPAWQVTEIGPALEVMKLVDTGVPPARPGQVLLQVSACALGFPDAMLTVGQHAEHPPLPFTPGIEVCGEIVGVGPGVDPLRIGERVVGTTALPHGGLATFAVAADGDVLPAPPALNDVDAAAFHVSYQTGWFGLYRRAGLRAGDFLLVHAAAGGLGTAAVQLGRAAGARVIGVVGSPEKVETAARAGAQTVIDRSSHDVVEAVLQVTGGRGADVVYDPVGGQAFEQSTQAVAMEGRIVVVGFASGQLARLATNHAVHRNYGVLGVHWGMYRTRTHDLVLRAHEDLNRLAEARALRPMVSRELEFEQAAEGIAQIGAGTTVGRLVVKVPEPL
jgi:NADPH2:quinone reductase